MKKTQLLDALRNIRKEFVAFLSIILIGLLASLSYLGISYSSATLRKDALTFFNENGLWDLELASTLLLDEEDFEAVRALPGVRQVERVWQVDGKLRVKGSDTGVTLMSLPEELCRPVLVEGRLPESASECAVEQVLLEKCELSIGQRITPEVKPISGIEPLSQESFVITGVFRTPEHITYMFPVTPLILVPRESFGLDALGGAFMKLRIRVNAPADRYSEAYWDAVAPVEEALNAMAPERCAERREKLRAANEGQLEDAQRQLDEGQEKLAAARRQIEEGREQLAEAEAILSDALRQLNTGMALLKEGESQLRYYTEVVRNLRDKGIDWADGNLGPEDLPPAFPIPYEEFMLLLHTASKEQFDWLVALAENKLNAYKAEAYANVRKWYDAGEEYLDALTRFEQGQKQLEQGERDLALAQAQWDEANERVQEGRRLLDAIGEGRWLVFNDRSNAGYLYADANATKLSSLSMSFSSIFLLVGALVIYATVGRMVEEQRTLIGAVKAMGLYNREVFLKYLLFACTAALTGVGLGVLLAWLPLQRTILNSYEKLLNYGTGTRSFLPLESGLVVAGALAISAVAVYLGCGRLLRMPAIRLMQPGEVKSGRKKARSSASRSLYVRLIFRNMRTDLSRVLVTIVSIAGGCALMVIGFTLRYGISGVPDRQFGGIMTYGAEVYYSLDENPDAADQIDAILSENGLPHVGVYKASSVFEAFDSLDSLTLIVAEGGSLDGYFRMNALDGSPLALPESGALVPRRFFEHFSLGPGDAVAVYDTEMNRRSLTIAGVFENYYGQLFFLTPGGFAEAFGAEPGQNCYFVRTGELELDALREKLAEVEGLTRVTDAAAERTVIEQFTSSLNLVVWLMLFIAGLMACFIVANFTVTFIQRKTRELTIMRINGFSAAECIRYLAADLVVTTLCGTLLGLMLGSVIGRAVLSTTETPYIQMIREPSVQTYLYSALITCGFSALTNAVALRRVKKLKLSDL